MFWSAAEIRSRREQRGLTQQQLADALGASRRAVVGWETGATAPQGRFIGQLERVLGDERAPSESDAPGPLLRDATFVETVNHLVDLYNQSIMSGVRPVLEVDNGPLPVDFTADHHVVAGPDETKVHQTDTDGRASHYAETCGRKSDRSDE